MGKLLVSILMVGLLMASSPLQAEESPRTDPDGTPSELLEGAAQRLVRALELILMAIPQYEAPELLENGDIIIRRKPRVPYRKHEDPKGSEEPNEQKI